MSEARTLLTQAEDAVDANRKQEARELLRKLLAIEPHNSYAWELFSYVAQGRDTAMDCLRRAMELDPSNYSAWRELVKKVGADKAKTCLPAGAPIPTEPAPVTLAPVTGLKRCPFCAEEVQAAAIVCKHCGHDVTGASPASPAVNTVSSVIIVLLVLLGLFWIAIGLIQIAVGLAQPAAVGYGTMGVGALNLLVSLVNLWQIRAVVRRERSVVNSLVLLAVVGFLWGGWQLLTGAWLQVCAVPIYLILGILALVNKDHFSVGAKPPDTPAA